MTIQCIYYSANNTCIFYNDSDKQCKSGQSNSAVIEQVQHQQKEILTVKDDCEKLMPNQLCYNSMMCALHFVV